MTQTLGFGPSRTSRLARPRGSRARHRESTAAENASKFETFAIHVSAIALVNPVHESANVGTGPLFSTFIHSGHRPLGLFEAAGPARGRPHPCSGMAGSCLLRHGPQFVLGPARHQGSRSGVAPAGEPVFCCVLGRRLWPILLFALAGHQSMSAASFTTPNSCDRVWGRRNFRPLAGRGCCQFLSSSAQWARPPCGPAWGC